jgi:hypothetical protein
MVSKFFFGGGGTISFYVFRGEFQPLLVVEVSSGVVWAATGTGIGACLSKSATNGASLKADSDGLTGFGSAGLSGGLPSIGSMGCKLSPSWSRFNWISFGRNLRTKKFLTMNFAGTYFFLQKSTTLPWRVSRPIPQVCLVAGGDDTSRPPCNLNIFKCRPQLSTIF